MAELSSSSTSATNETPPVRSQPNMAPPRVPKEGQSGSLSWTGDGGPSASYPSSHYLSIETPLSPPPPAHTAPPLTGHDVEDDIINEYTFTSDPRFRDSTLVFPRISQNSNSSSPFWAPLRRFFLRHRVGIFTVLASLVAIGFLLAAVVGSIKIKDD